MENHRYDEKRGCWTTDLLDKGLEKVQEAQKGKTEGACRVEGFDASGHKENDLSALGLYTAEEYAARELEKACGCIREASRVIVQSSRRKAATDLAGAPVPRQDAKPQEFSADPRVKCGQIAERLRLSEEECGRLRIVLRGIRARLNGSHFYKVSEMSSLILEAILDIDGVLQRKEG